MVCPDVAINSYSTLSAITISIPAHHIQPLSNHHSASDETNTKKHTLTLTLPLPGPPLRSTHQPRLCWYLLNKHIHDSRHRVHMGLSETLATSPTPPVCITALTTGYSGHWRLEKPPLMILYRDRYCFISARCPPYLYCHNTRTGFAGRGRGSKSIVVIDRSGWKIKTSARTRIARVHGDSQAPATWL